MVWSGAKAPRPASPKRFARPRCSGFPLPPHVQPRHLQVRYPRIANRLAAEWDHIAVCETYFESLLTDKRGGRKGFPLAVAQEIAVLRDYYFRLHHKNLTPWDHVEAGR
jgi:hypothetical protein